MIMIFATLSVGEVIVKSFGITLSKKKKGKVLIKYLFIF